MKWLELLLFIIIILLFLIKSENKRLILTAVGMLIVFIVFWGLNTINVQKNFYNCINMYYYTMKDVKSDLFTNQGELKENDKLGRYFSETSDELEPLVEIMNSMSKLNFRFNMDDYSFLSEYFYQLGRYSYHHELSLEDQKTLKEIIRKSELLNTYIIISSPNYSKHFDPVKPTVRMNNELKEIKKLCEDAVSRMRKQKCD